MKALFIICTLAVAVLPACDYVDGLHHQGRELTKHVVLGKFEYVNVKTPVALVLQQSDDSVARISGQDFRVESVQFSIKNGELIITSKDDVYSRKDQIVRIHLPVQKLNRVMLNAPTELIDEGGLVLEDFSLISNGLGTYSESDLHLQCNSIFVAAFGNNSGQHRLRGACENMHIIMEGLAWVEASGFKAVQAEMIQRSLKNTYLNVASGLTVKMYSSGHVIYAGLPVVSYETFPQDWKVEFGKAIHQSE
ncbi:MAG: hypothetical protein HC819_02150 [Cyclobacteriaceae bacterium]|nr:hypothetical protein [Cyclobacteriaceae bacterium]